MADLYALPGLVTALALVLYQYTGARVGRARGKYGVNAPAITGNVDFERVYRVQMNTLEQLMFFLPSLWLFTLFLDAPKSAAALGLVWVLARVAYARSYYKGKNRGGGFLISLLAAVILLLGGFVGIAHHLIATLG